MRGWPKRQQRVVTLRVDTVQSAMMVAAQPSPVCVNADASGVDESSRYQGCMPVTTRLAPT
jgi:hypothetical protein